MQVRVEYKGGVRFEAEARGHRVVCDQPPSNGGEDAGMTPPEFLLVSLGTCAGFYAAQYLRTRGLPADNLEVLVSAEKATAPARLDRFEITVKLGPLEPRHVDGVTRAVRSCLIHKTLEHSPEVGLCVEAGEPCRKPAAA
ncbi:MAG: OsmC family protein [Bryobacteraceae bacterium]